MAPKVIKQEDERQGQTPPAPIKETGGMLQLRDERGLPIRITIKPAREALAEGDELNFELPDYMANN